jgi:3-hydroxyisobutyrate dehydrogenase-like beta-hydroxyacid dehydrogenase
MGAAMASRLIGSGADVAVWNRTASKADPLVDLGASRLENVRAAAGRETAFSMVLDDRALDQVAAELLPAATAEGGRLRVWIDGSTVSTGAAERAAAAAAAAGVAYVSAPISGNPGVVESGRAIFAISGDERGLDVAEAIGLAIGRAVYRVGDSTQANVVKLATNALLAVTMQSLAEIAVLADAAGVRRGDLMQFVNDSAIGSPFTAYKTEAITSLEFPPAFTPSGQRKDIRLAIDLGYELEVPMPVLSTTEVAYSRLVSGGLGEGRDFAALLLEVARDAGRELQPEAAR